VGDTSLVALAPFIRCEEVVRKGIVEPDNNEIDAAYTDPRNLHMHDPGRTR
jgi:hypothetical protein